MNKFISEIKKEYVIELGLLFRDWRVFPDEEKPMYEGQFRKKVSGLFALIDLYEKAERRNTYKGG